MPNFKVNLDNLIGQKFSDLTVLSCFREKIKNDKQNGYVIFCICRCECGKITRPIYLSNLKSKKCPNKSCGCKKAVRFKKQKYGLKHGFNEHPLYNIYVGMHHRCFNSKREQFSNYGGRGITICDEWLSEKYGGLPDYQGLKNFLKWAEGKAKEQGISSEDLYYKKNISGQSKFYSIERIDNDKSYFPSNCKWATAKEQANNQRPRRNRIKL